MEGQQLHPLKFFMDKQLLKFFMDKQLHLLQARLGFVVFCFVLIFSFSFFVLFFFVCVLGRMLIKLLFADLFNRFEFIFLLSFTLV